MNSKANRNSGATPPAVSRLANCSLSLGAAFWILIAVLIAYNESVSDSTPSPISMPMVLIMAVLPFAAIVCGHIALGKIKRSDGTLVGKGRGRIGMALGYLAVLAALGFIAYIIWELNYGHPGFL